MLYLFSWEVGVSNKMFLALFKRVIGIPIGECEVASGSGESLGGYIG